MLYMSLQNFPYESNRFFVSHDLQSGISIPMFGNGFGMARTEFYYDILQYDMCTKCHGSSFVVWGEEHLCLPFALEILCA